MKRFCISLFLLCSTAVSAQSVEINGTVKDTKGEPVYAANVFLKSNSSIGTISDFNGKFSITLTGEFRNQVLLISFLGYIPKEVPLSSIDTDKELEIVLEENQLLLDAVVVTSKDPVAEYFSVKKLEKLDIYTEPVSQGDPLKAVTVLPASTTTDESASPSLRGSPGSRSRVFLNRVPIFEPVRFNQLTGIGVFSLFNTEIVDKQYVYASNPPVAFGNSSAGLVQIETIKQLESDQLQLSSGLANTGAFLSKKLGDKSFVQLYANNQFSNLFIDVNEPNVETLNDFSTSDGGINFHSDLSSELSLNLYSYANVEDFDVTTRSFAFEGSAKADGSRNFSILNLEYQRPRSSLSLNSSYDIRNQDFEFGNILSDTRRISIYNSLDYQFNIDNDVVELGLNYNYNSMDFDNLSPEFFFALSADSPTTPLVKSISRESVESYIYSTFNLSDNLIGTAGVRTNSIKNDTRSYWSWQLALRYNLLSDQSFLLSGGRYHNFSIPNAFVPDFTLQNSYQLALDYERTTDKTIITAAVFYKEEDENSLLSNFVTQNKTTNLGIELSYTQAIGKQMRFFIANTYLDQKVKFDGKTFSGSSDFNYFVKSSFSYNNVKIVNAALTYISRPGTRFTSITGSDFDPLTGFFEPSFNNQFNDQRLRSYHSVNATVSKIVPVQGNALIAFFSANNILNHQNEQSLFFNADYTSSKANLLQQRTFYFGFVWQWNR